MTLIKDRKTDFIQRAYHRGFCSRGQIGLSSKCNKEKWEFINKEQGGGQWIVSE